MISRLRILLCAACAAAAAQGAEPADSAAVRPEVLREVVVTANSARRRLQGLRLGAESLELSKFASLPGFGGENDIIKSRALLPGVRSEGDAGGGFEVRGGNASQNHVLLDGISLYNPSHLMGIFSTFNDQAISGATLFKGPIPAGFGGASSAVLETALAPGDMESYHASASVGLLAAKVKVEGPVIKEKLSFAATARRSYVDAFLKLVPQYRSTVMNFYDITAKLRYRPDALNIVDGSFFISHDNLAISKLMGLYWGNLGAALNWTARTRGIATFTTTAALTRFEPKMTADIMDIDQTMWTYIHNYALNEKIRLAFSERHNLEAGVRSDLSRVKSAEWDVNGQREREIRSLIENSAWADYSGNFANRLELSAGLRLNVSSVLSSPRARSYSSIMGAEAQFAAKTYVIAEPRVNLKYNISPLHNLKAGYGVSSQNLHSIRSSATSFPFDRYSLTSAAVRPERSTLYAAGYCGMTPDGSFDWSAEGYYRTIDNVYDFKDGRNMMSEISLESLILGGRGRSYGAEFMVRKNSGKLTGWISYTISRTQTKIAGINGGEWYNATNDRRHDFSVTAIYQFNERWSASGSWIYLSGQPLTAPDVKYEIAGETCYYYSRRNGYMTPATHRLDLSAKYVHTGRRLTYEWAFGLYNAYFRYNPYVVYFTDAPDSPSGTKAVVSTILPILPSVSYTLKF